MKRVAGVLLVLVGLAGCHHAAEKKSDDQRTAVGEVLPGSVSDRMLPYDALSSQPPLAPPERGKDTGAGEAADSAAPAAGDAASAPDAVPGAAAAGSAQ